MEYTGYPCYKLLRKLVGIASPLVKNKLGMSVLIEINRFGKTVAMATALRSLILQEDMPDSVIYLFWGTIYDVTLASFA